MKKMSMMKTIKLLCISMLMLMMCISVGSCSGDEYSTRIHELLIQKDITFEAVDLVIPKSLSISF